MGGHNPVSGLVPRCILCLRRRRRAPSGSTLGLGRRRRVAYSEYLPTWVGVRASRTGGSLESGVGRYPLKWGRVTLWSPPWSWLRARVRHDHNEVRRAMEGPSPLRCPTDSGMDELPGRIVAADAQGLVVRAIPGNMGT